MTEQAGKKRAHSQKGAVSIKDIAAHLGLSHGTVSRALNDKPSISAETKLRVRKAVDEFGYIANSGGRLLRGLPSSLVGLIIPDVQNDFYSSVAKVLAENCARENLQLILSISEDDPDLEYRHIRSLLEARVGGIVITPTSGLRRQSAQLLASVPRIQLIRRHNLIKSYHVGIDDRAAVHMGTRHLVELGHRRIGFIGGSRDLSTGESRLGGFYDGLREGGIDPNEAAVALGPPRPEFGEAAVRELWKKGAHHPSALVLGSSQLTAGALNALKAFGLSLPADVSVVGYGDPVWYRLTGTPITTVALPTKELTSSAASLLFQQMRQASGTSFADATKGASEVSISFPAVLAVRSSTAPLSRPTQELASTSPAPATGHV